MSRTRAVALFLSLLFHIIALVGIRVSQPRVPRKDSPVVIDLSPPRNTVAEHRPVKHPELPRPNTRELAREEKTEPAEDSLPTPTPTIAVSPTSTPSALPTSAPTEIPTRESDLRVPSVETDGRGDPKTPSDGRLWMVLAAAGLLLLIVEWALYQRRWVG